MPVTSAAISAGTQALAGGVQAIIGGAKKRRYLNQLDAMRDPTVTSNKAIGDYYNQAKELASANPYNSQMYRMQEQNIQRASNQGLSALQDRRSAIGGISRIVGLQEDNLRKAGVGAEQQRMQALGQFGNAAGMKAADDKYVFNINKVQPFQRQYNLLNMKASGAAATEQAGLKNMFGGVSGASSLLGSMGGGAGGGGASAASGSSGVPSSYAQYSNQPFGTY